MSGCTRAFRDFRPHPVKKKSVAGWHSISRRCCRLPLTVSRPQLSAAHWVTADEEAALIRCTHFSPPQCWTQLRGRSLGGLPRPLPEGFAPEPLPGWVGTVCDALVRSGVFPPDAPPNHVLLNEYQPGQGIDAHRDGPLCALSALHLALHL